jgi:hypothetical protein
MFGQEVVSYSNNKESNFLYMQMCVTIYPCQDWTFTQTCTGLLGSDCHFTKSVKVSLEKDL